MLSLDGARKPKSRWRAVATIYRAKHNKHSSERVLKACGKVGYTILRPTMSSDYGSWTVKLLKTALSDRRAKTSGRKAELIERLESYDRNDDFRGTTTIQLPESVPMPTFPGISTFRTLTETDQQMMPKVTHTKYEQQMSSIEEAVLLIVMFQCTS
jgi:hypothetical protein